MRVDVDAIASGTLDSERQRRRCHLKDLPGIQAPHAQVERALRHLDLRDTIAQVKDLDAGVRPEPDGGAAHLKLRAGIAIGPQPIAADQRTIAHHADPLVFASGRVAHLALGVVEARHAPRRIVIGRARERRRAQCVQREQREQQHAHEDR